jgi:hypothetical protein
VAQLKLIPGEGGRRKPAADQYECDPTFLGLRAWELDQAIDRRKAFRIMKTEPEGETTMEALLDDLIGKLTALRNLVVVRQLVADLNAIRLPGPELSGGPELSVGFSPAQLREQRALDDAIFLKRQELADLHNRKNKLQATLATLNAKVAKASHSHVEMENSIAGFKKQFATDGGGLAR